jgi:hypothetical protein
MSNAKRISDPKYATDPMPTDAGLELKKLQAYYLAGGQCAKCDRLLVYSAFGRQDEPHGWRISRRPTDSRSVSPAATRIALCWHCPVD